MYLRSGAHAHAICHLTNNGIESCSNGHGESKLVRSSKEVVQVSVIM